MQENAQLKLRLTQYECKETSQKTHKVVKPGVFLCIFLLVVGVNLDFIR